MTEDSAIVVLTRESLGEIVLNGGVGGLTLQPRHARKQRYVVCVRNDRNTNPASGEPHRTAFLVGTISGLEVSSEQDGVKRWRLLFDTCARTSIPDVWKGWRNPVVYKSLSELGIDPIILSFSRSERAEERAEGAPVDEIGPLTIAQAKAGLAKGLGLPPAQIEITITIQG